MHHEPFLIPLAGVDPMILQSWPQSFKNWIGPPKLTIELGVDLLGQSMLKILGLSLVRSAG